MTDTFGTVGGGFVNSAGGAGATVPGGIFNKAMADYSFAAGYHAVANASGCFVWADHSTSSDFICDRVNEFALQAAGGMHIESDRGIRLNASTTPLITRGYDPFDDTARPLFRITAGGDCSSRPTPWLPAYRTPGVRTISWSRNTRSTAITVVSCPSTRQAMWARPEPWSPPPSFPAAIATPRRHSPAWSPKRF